MTVPELRSLAKARGLRGYSRLRKADLEALLGVEKERPLRELRVIARQLAIRGRSRMRKADLAKAVASLCRARTKTLDDIIDECSRPSQVDLVDEARERDTQAYLLALRTACLGREYADALLAYQRHEGRATPRVKAILDQASRMAWQRARDASGDRATWWRRHEQYLRACGQQT